MKNVITFFAALLLVFTAFAGDVTIRMDNQSKYDVYIDGRNVSYYSGRNDRIRLNDLSNGRHRLEVYQRNTYNQNRGSRNRDYDKRDRNNRNWQSKGRLVHSTNFNVKPQSDVTINIDKKGKAKIKERRSNDRYERNDKYGNDRYDRRNDNGNYGGSYGGSYGGNSSRAISSYQLDEMVKKIRSQWFGKLSYAKNAVNENYFYTDQVRQVLEIFSSEKDRLELAKVAYYRTVDVQNFRQLYNLFSSQGQAELDRTIGRTRY